MDDETGKQWLTFVDPKGLRQMDLSHPKLNLYKEVKVLEKALADQAKEDGPQLLLNAFILSPTKYADLLNIGGTIKNEELENKHVLFIEDGPGVYLSKLFGQLID